MYHEREKLMKLRSHLYQRCGVVLDDFGQPAADKAVQVEDTGMDEPFFVVHIHIDYGCKYRVKTSLSLESN